MIVGSVLALTTANCTKDDIGAACHPTTSAVPVETISGEQPMLEVIALQRSIDCETFQCLTYVGYDPFCTRTCTYDSKQGAACTANSDCTQPLHCYDGFCRDDDCPAGFECRTVQDVGPLAGKLYCVYKVGCAGSNRDCEALGDMECRRLGCFDKALLATDTTTPHTLTCEPQAQLSFCQCADGTASCSGAGLVCSPPNHDVWPAGSVDLRDVCMRSN